ncbi:S-layer homology domain-containing protein [Pontibacillus salipaludis]|uniref:S-layer homology domain-containing protein n=1 Tax=Pontibacillus salipaludis TaxID=1697394 RepID=UPI0031ED102C
MKKSSKNIQGLLATSLAVSTVVSVPVASVSAEEGTNYDSVQELDERLDGVYDQLSEADREMLQAAREAFVEAPEETWTQLLQNVTVEQLTNEELKQFMVALSDIVYADNTEDLNKAIVSFLNTYDKDWLEAKFGVSVTSDELLNLIALMENWAFDLLESDSNEYGEMLQSIYDEGEIIDDETFEVVLNETYTKVVEKFKDEDFKYHEAYQKVQDGVSVDLSELTRTLVGLKNDTRMNDETIRNAQQALLKAVLAELDADTDIDLDPVDGEVIVDNKAVTVTKGKNAQGKTVVKVTFNADKFAKAVKAQKPEDVKSVKVKVTKENGNDVAEVSIPSKAFNAVKEKNDKAVFEVETDGATYKLPVNEVDTDELAKGFATQLGDATLTSEDVEISVQMNEVADEEVESSLNGNKLKKASKVIEFKVEAKTKDGKGTKEIKRFKQYVEREIEGETEFDFTHSTAVRLNEDGSFTPVPTVFEGTTATVKSMTNSMYTVVENEKTFSDIGDTWNKDTIEKLASKYIIQGKKDGTYAPKDYIKRSEFTTLMSRALGLVEEDAAFDSVFPDVKEGKWYALHVEAAVEAGIIKGREDGSFDPDSYVTRNETAAMIKRAMDFVKYDKAKLTEDKATTYKDYDQIANWSKENVETLLQAGIMGGRSNGNFDPYGDINRAEMAKVLDEFLSFVELMNK